MSNSSKIVLLGSGNVATQLGLALVKAGHQITQVYSRTLTSAAILANKLNCAHTDSITAINLNADIYIISVKDDAISKITEQLSVNDQIIAHTAGSIPMETLKSSSSNYGVFYPLQTFSKDKNVDFNSIPICIESNNEETLGKLKVLAESLSNQVNEINFEQRQALHLSAVFACNFTNHMYAVAAELLKNKNLPFELILPLIKETNEKLNHLKPAEGQTGPAIRHDEVVLKKHIDLLTEKKDYQNIYKLLTESIQQNNNG